MLFSMRKNMGGSSRKSSKIGPERALTRAGLFLNSVTKFVSNQPPKLHSSKHARSAQFWRLIWIKTHQSTATQPPKTYADPST